MKPKKRQKLCQNCEGDIDLDVIVCPYCAADLREERPEENLHRRREEGEKERALYSTARVSPLRQPTLPGEQAMSQSLYPSLTAPEREGAVEEKRPAMDVDKTLEQESVQHIIWPIFLFTVGVQLFMMGLLLILFSNHGTVLLKWDARLWFLYPFAATPFLVFGYRALSKL